MRRTAALIVGGGPAGSAAAIALARGGTRALMLERTAAPADALCGGFLSWRTLDALAALGIDADTLNPRPVTRVRLFAAGRSAAGPLPRPARGVSRRRLDRLLRDAAAATGAAVETGVNVRALDRRTARLEDGTLVIGDAVLLATGKHDLRGAQRPGTPDDDPTLGLRVRLAPAPALDRLVGDAIELHLFDRGYAGLVLQEDASANLCLAVHRSRLIAAGSPLALLAALGRECPALGERLAWLAADAAVDAVANVPYGWRARDTEPGVFRLGDQAGVIPSLAGEGMGIAIASGTAAAAALLAGTPASDFQRRFARRLARPIGVATLIRRAAASPALARWLVGAARAAPLVDIAARLTRINQSPVDAASVRTHI